MQTTHLWHQLHLRWAKIVFLALIGLGLGGNANGQGFFGLTNFSGSDDKLTSYGFFLGTHTASYQLKYADSFLDPTNTIISIFPKYTPGFSLGFIGILRFHDQVNLIFTPKIGFYEYKLDVNYDDGTSEELENDVQQIELPLLFKYRSMRFNNTRMYFIGGGSYLFNTKPQADIINEYDIATAGRDFTIEAGMGFEIYFKYFKFAPEIRFSHGINNLYIDATNTPQILGSISSLRSKSISILLNFQ